MCEFTKPSENHVFSNDDEIYVIDKNGVDLWKAKIKKVNKKSFVVSFDDIDEDERRYKDASNFIERNENNNKIYEEQVKKRKEIEEEMKRKEEEEEKENEERKKEKKEKKQKIKRIKAKKSVFNHQEIVKSAWSRGIREIEQFRKYMTKNLNKAMELYDKYYKMMNINEFHMFLLTKVNKDDEDKFWKDSLVLWQKMFPNDVTVSTELLVRKLAEIIKLPNQTESNARNVLEFIFDPENNKETDFSQFCAFLAMFGPSSTAIRKISHILKCPDEIKDNLIFTDLPELNDPNNDIETTAINCFTLNPDSETPTNIYNNPLIDANGEYLIDDNGTKYSSWEDLFAKNKST